MLRDLSDLLLVIFALLLLAAFAVGPCLSK